MLCDILPSDHSKRLVTGEIGGPRKHRDGLLPFGDDMVVKIGGVKGDKQFQINPLLCKKVSNLLTFKKVRNLNTRLFLFVRSRESIIRTLTGINQVCIHSFLNGVRSLHEQEASSQTHTHMPLNVSSRGV